MVVFIVWGVEVGCSLKYLVEICDVVIICLFSLMVCVVVVEGLDGILDGIGLGMIWVEMLMMDVGEVKWLVDFVIVKGVEVIECLVFGGCYWVVIGNIFIFVGCFWRMFEKVLLFLIVFGCWVLYIGEIGFVFVLKVVINYLVMVNFVLVCEVLIICKVVGMDFNMVYEVIWIFFGILFVYEMEG